MPSRCGRHVSDRAASRSRSGDAPAKHAPGWPRSRVGCEGGKGKWESSGRRGRIRKRPRGACGGRSGRWWLWPPRRCCCMNRRVGRWISPFSRACRLTSAPSRAMPIRSAWFSVTPSLRSTPRVFAGRCWSPWRGRSSSSCNLSMCWRSTGSWRVWGPCLPWCSCSFSVLHSARFSSW